MFCSYFNAFAKRLEADTEGIVLITGDGPMTYFQLGQRVAPILKAMDGYPRKGPVLIRGHKETDVVAAMVASTLAGRGFVFAETTYPRDRVDQIVKICGCQVIINTSRSEEAFSVPQLGAYRLKNENLEAPLLSSAVEDCLFYVTFTSGSTGQPKGIPISRANFSSLMNWMIPHIKNAGGSGGASINHASMAFDMSMSDIWLAILFGRASYLLDHCNNTNPHANISLLTRYPEAPANSIMSTPVFIAILLETPQFSARRFPQLQAFWVGGEEVPKQLLKRLRVAFPSSEILHAYGPSEVTCVTHCHPLKDADLESNHTLPLGKALGETTVLVDVGGGELRSIGEGEIVLVGEQVASGYLPKSHPNNVNFGTYEGQRSYHTGDLGAISEKGSMTILGRIDRQIKLNGFRIELGAIEECAMDVENVKVAVVVPQNTPANSLTLIVSGGGLTEGSKAVVRSHLEAHLPPCMVPSRIEIGEKIPYSLSGKIDRKKIAAGYV